MKHLTPAELVDFVEGALPGARAAHVEGCAACRGLADDLRAALQAAAGDEPPEPSPLFWDRLSARVRETVAAEPDRRTSWGWLWRPVVGLPLAAALVVVIVGAVVWRVGPVPPGERAPEATAVDAAAGNLSEDLAMPSDDGSWDVMAMIAATIDWEDAEAAGFSATPGAADRAVQLLTPQERTELARLLSVEGPREQM